MKILDTDSTYFGSTKINGRGQRVDYFYHDVSVTRTYEIFGKKVSVEFQTGHEKYGNCYNSPANDFSIYFENCDFLVDLIFEDDLDLDDIKKHFPDSDDKAKDFIIKLRNARDFIESDTLDVYDFIDVDQDVPEDLECGSEHRIFLENSCDEQIRP
jgi:hypothetical protein